ncbi:hypothetical protein G9A89_017312 [Geosiphon pyriformis]|nr:hypothetical protein G9A89_017312 [Geosiphon pyriformis]
MVYVARTDVDKELWDDFIGSVSEKTCAINYHPVTYAWARYAVVCFELTESLDVVMDTTPVLRDVNLCWFYLSSSKCAKYGKLGHMLLSCSDQVGNVVMGKSLGGTTGDKTAVNLDFSMSSKSCKQIFFIVLSGNFNKDDSCKIINHGVANVGDYFDSDHKAVSVRVGLGRLLNMHLNSIYKQVNKDHWKFNIKNTNETKWLEFKGAMSVNAFMFTNKFNAAVRLSDLDAI